MSQNAIVTKAQFSRESRQEQRAGVLHACRLVEYGTNCKLEMAVPGVMLMLWLFLCCRADRIAKLTNHISIRVQERAEA